jgi:predicted secreted protein
MILSHATKGLLIGFCASTTIYIPSETDLFLSSVHVWLYYPKDMKSKDTLSSHFIDQEENRSSSGLHKSPIDVLGNLSFPRLNRWPCTLLSSW